MIKITTGYDHKITEDGIIEVRKITRFFEDEEFLAKSYARHTVDISEVSEDEDDRTKKIAVALQEPEVLLQSVVARRPIKEATNVEEVLSETTEKDIEDILADGKVTKTEKVSFWKRLLRRKKKEEKKE